MNCAQLVALGTVVWSLSANHTLAIWEHKTVFKQAPPQWWRWPGFTSFCLLYSFSTIFCSLFCGFRAAHVNIHYILGQQHLKDEFLECVPTTPAPQFTFHLVISIISYVALAIIWGPQCKHRQGTLPLVQWIEVCWMSHFQRKCKCLWKGLNITFPILHRWITEPWENNA